MNRNMAKIHGPPYGGRREELKEAIEIDYSAQQSRIEALGS
jgi:hypothetical protein